MTFANIKRKLKKGTILRCIKNDYSKYKTSIDNGRLFTYYRYIYYE